MSNLFGLTGRNALITGGSRSMGRAIALGLAEYGANVAVNGVAALDAQFGESAAAEHVCEAARKHGGVAVVTEGDLSSPGVPQRVFAEAEAALGSVDILVLCASVQYRALYEDITTEQFNHQVALNLRAVLELAQLAVPSMARRGWGRVLAIGSVQQVRPHNEMAVYAALKSAQLNLMQNLARQHAHQGVTSNNISPGLMDTDRNLDQRRDPAGWQALVEGANPMQRAGQADEVVGAALLLCSDAGAFITGEDISVAGGGQLPR